MTKASNPFKMWTSSSIYHSLGKGYRPILRSFVTQIFLLQLPTLICDYFQVLDCYRNRKETFINKETGNCLPHRFLHELVLTLWSWYLIKDE